MSDLEPEAKAKRRIDTFVYGAVALGMVGINVEPWFEAHEKISIAKAQADAKVYILKTELEIAREKSKLPPELLERLNTLEDSMKLLKQENDELKLLSHEPGG